MTAVDTEVDEVEKMFAVNVFGAMRVVAAVHKLLVRARGTIVSIGSVGGISPYVYGGKCRCMTLSAGPSFADQFNPASYNASKAALHHYSNTLRVEMHPFG